MWDLKRTVNTGFSKERRHVYIAGLRSIIGNGTMFWLPTQTKNNSYLAEVENLSEVLAYIGMPQG